MARIGERMRRWFTCVVAALGAACVLPPVEAFADATATTEVRGEHGEGDEAAGLVTTVSVDEDAALVATDRKDGCAGDPDPAECRQWNKDCHYNCNKYACIKEGRACGSCHDCCSGQLDKCLNKDRRTDFGGCQ